MSENDGGMYTGGARAASGWVEGVDGRVKEEVTV